MTDYRISLNETNVVKGVAICAMLVHHLFLDVAQYGEALYGLAVVGKVCVSLFLFLSGYGLAVQYGKVLGAEQSRLRRCRNTLKFLCKRYLKFYLNYWVIFAIAVPLGVFAFGRSLTIAYGTDVSLVPAFIKDFFGLAGFGSYNITWWFNRLILILYFFFPLLYWLMSRRFIVISSSGHRMNNILL